MESPPTGIHLVETRDGFEISASFRDGLFGTHVVLLALGFTAAGLSTLGIAFSAFHHTDSGGWVKPILFGLCGLLLTYLGLCATVGAFIRWFGTFVFRLAGDEAMFTTRFFGKDNGKWARTCRWSDVRELSVAMVDGNPPTEEFALVLRDGSRLVFLDGMRGKKLAFLTAFFKRKVDEAQGCGGMPGPHDVHPPILSP